jgi:DNA-binding transcriptional regulator YdaS (Cro superfamily)
MTPADLRAISDSLNDERGTGGQSKLARLCGWDHSTVHRKLTGKSKIKSSDELAILKAIESAPESSTSRFTMSHG